ncbi:MAG TPA: helix-turn-helix domain-containing protein [Chloroflexota bacterium]|nr:helix-turn-helix domain-containing protein [Chloroflexota bacterium]
MNHITPQPPHGPHGTSLSVAEAAAALHIRPEEVLRHIRAGDLPHLRLPGQDGIEFRVLPEDVAALRDRLAPESDPVVDQHEGNGHAGRPESRAETPLTAEVLSETLAAALGPLLAQQKQLLSETARLREMVTVQAERIAELEAATAVEAPPRVAEERAPSSSEPEKADFSLVDGERPPAPDEPLDDEHDLGSQVRALREELALLRERRQQADDGAFQQAWRRVQRRPWWADLLD